MKTDVIIAVIFFVIGFNIGLRNITTDHVWPKERQGLMIINKQMEKDNSKRMGMIVLTEKNGYMVSALDKNYIFYGGIIDKKSNLILKEFVGNLQ